MTETATISGAVPVAPADATAARPASATKPDDLAFAALLAGLLAQPVATPTVPAELAPSPLATTASAPPLVTPALPPVLAAPAPTVPPTGPDTASPAETVPSAVPSPTPGSPTGPAMPTAAAPTTTPAAAPPGAPTALAATGRSGLATDRETAAATTAPPFVSGHVPAPTAAPEPPPTVPAMAEPSAASEPEATDPSTVAPAVAPPVAGVGRRTQLTGASPFPGPTAPTEAPAAQVVRALGPLRAGPDGSRELSLELRPEGLGTVHLTVRVEKGMVHLAMAAETPAAAQVLTASIDDLRAGLESAGLTAGSLAVRPDGDRARSGADHAERDAGDHRRVREDAAVPILPGPTGVTAEGLDLLL